MWHKKQSISRELKTLLIMAKEKDKTRRRVKRKKKNRKIQEEAKSYPSCSICLTAYWRRCKSSPISRQAISCNRIPEGRRWLRLHRTRNVRKTVVNRLALSGEKGLYKRFHVKRERFVDHVRLFPSKEMKQPEYGKSWCRPVLRWYIDVGTMKVT